MEGRKKKPEYVATVTRGYREFLSAVARGESAPATPEQVAPLVQIFSRGFTGGMYGGRAGRDYITRGHPDNRGRELGVVVGSERGEIVVDVAAPLAVGDGLGFEPPLGAPGESTGFQVTAVRTLGALDGVTRQAVTGRGRVPAGWRVVRSSDAELLARARASYAGVSLPSGGRRTPVRARVFGQAGAPLKLVLTADDDTVAVRGEIALAPATRRALDNALLREQLGRLGDTPFVLGALDDAGLAPGLFVPVSELNRLRQAAVDELLPRRDWAEQARLGERTEAIRAAVAQVGSGRVEVGGGFRAPSHLAPPTADVQFRLVASVYTADDARAAAAAGATEVVFDPFLRHPAPPVARVRALADELASLGVAFRLRTPTIVRSAERRFVDKWLGAGLPLLSGHLGLVGELAAAGRDVVADYAVNAFNEHTAAALFALGARRIVASVELTVDELAAVARPWDGAGFDVLAYGRPEGMTIEHCVLSAAFDRVPTTCRDLCVQKHTNVELTDPAGYSFAVATDSACRNRLLHSRPVEASEFLPALWAAGIRGYHLVFNVPGDPIPDVVARYRAALAALAAGARPDLAAVRALVGPAFTRGHFARAV